MLVYAGLMPQTPLLLPSIGHEVSPLLQSTIRGVHALIDELYSRKVETVLLISDHPTRHADHLSINLQDPYTFDLSEFGDFTFFHPVHPALDLIDNLQRTFRSKSKPLTLNTDSSLNFASAVPLYFIAEKLRNYKLLPIAPADLPTKELLALGNDLYDVIQHSKRRIAVIVTGDGSHSLNDKSPQAPTPAGKIFDKAIKDYILSGSLTHLLATETGTIAEANQALWPQICLLAGILQGMNVQNHLFSYDAPFGVGYFVGGFEPV